MYIQSLKGHGQLISSLNRIRQNLMGIHIMTKTSIAHAQEEDGVIFYS